MTIPASLIAKKNCQTAAGCPSGSTAISWGDVHHHAAGDVIPFSAAIPGLSAPMKSSRLKPSELPFPLRWPLGLLAVIGALRLAVVLIAVYAGVLAWATLVESEYGAAAAHFAIYDTGWFTALGVLLALNVLCAVIIRFPWKWRQSGFLVTHLGILILLAGCLATRHFGIEAQLPIFEGQTAHRAYQDSYHFQLQVMPAKPATAAAETICVPLAAGPFSWDRYAKLSWFPWHVAHRSQGTLYDADGIRLEILDYQSEPQPAAHVRLSVDGMSKELDVVGSSGESTEAKPQMVVAKRCRVTISMPLDEVELGFQLYLRRFQRKLDPGAGTASHYSSLVDFLDLGRPPRKLRDDVLITLNAPVDFTDPQSGRTYRLFQASFSGPWTPGEADFDQLVHGDRSRDQVYLSRLSVNYDPGRELKYLGSLMTVLGIALVYCLRSRNTNNGRRHAAAGTCVTTTDEADG
jgi:hypothetical protein